MKIRNQLILVETSLSLVLLLSVLSSVFSLVIYIRYEDVNVKALTALDTAKRTRYYLAEMPASTESSRVIISKYGALEKQLDQDITEIADDFFVGLAAGIQEEYQKIEDSWHETRDLVKIDDITILPLLNIRSEVDGNLESLLTMQAKIQRSEQAESSFVEELDIIIERIAEYENVYANFTTSLLHTFLPTLAQAIDQYETTTLSYTIVIPVLVLLISIRVIRLFASFLRRKLTVLNNTLNGVIRGDFSTRVELKGNDEFANLAGSINAFTKTMGNKLENFRLIMHDIGSTLETEFEATQTEFTQIESTLLNLAMKEAGANGAALYKVGSESHELVLSTSEGKFRPPFVVSELPDSPPEEDIRALLRSQFISSGETILGESTSYGKPIMIRDVEAEDGIDWKRSKDDPLYLASIIVVPLQVGSTVIGLLAITSSVAGNLFTDLEFANMQSFAELAAISLDNIYKYSDLLESAALERDIGIAEEIQRDLLPRKMPELSGASVACLSRSMKGLNGDYFDVYPIGNGKVMLTICEIVGRGIPASLVMVMIRTLLRTAASPNSDALSIIDKLNQDMTKQVFVENYASVGIFLVDTDGRFSYSSGSQDSAKILRAATKEIETLHTEGLPIGVDKNAKFQQIVGELSNRDLVLFHSDGIPESRDKNDNEFSIEKLLDIVKEQSENSPAQVVNAIQTELENFERDTQQKDDQTAIIFRFDGKKVVGDAA